MLLEPHPRSSAFIRGSSGWGSQTHFEEPRMDEAGGSRDREIALTEVQLPWGLREVRLRP